MTTAITHPTALADQIDAASNDARRALTTAAATGEAALIDPATPWLRKQVAEMARALTSGRARVCAHLTADIPPQVLHAAVWAPGLLTCVACRWLLIPSTAEDHTCDRCRRHVHPIHAGAVAAGPILLGYGLCTRCLTTITSPTVTEHPNRTPRPRKQRKP